MMGVLVDALGWAILHFLWQGALIGAACALILWTLRGAPARYRYATACIGLLVCLAWPAAELAQRSGAAWSAQAEVIHSQLLARKPESWRRPLVSDYAIDLTPHMAALWVTGVLLLTVRTGAGLLWIARSAGAPASPYWERRTAQLAARMGIRRRVGVRVLKELDSPVTAGWRRPLILLPAALTASVPAAQLDALLAHELAHIRRHDYLANLVQTLIRSLLFFHPVAWWLSRRIDAERELLADQGAALVLGDGRRLAQALAELERNRHTGFFAAQAATGGELLGRVRALLSPQAARLKLHAVAPAVFLAVGGVALAAQAASDATSSALTRRAYIDFDYCAKPVWPAAALAAELTGRVTLRFEVGRDGRITRATLVGSSGHPALDQAALEGIGKCRFNPAQVDGMPVASTALMQYVWLLE